MSQSSKSTKQTDKMPNLAVSSVEPMANIDHGKKRSASDQSEHVDKKMMVNDPSSSKPTTAIDATMSAGKNVGKETEVIESVPANIEIVDDITDEELLAMALMLESKMKQ